MPTNEAPEGALSYAEHLKKVKSELSSLLDEGRTLDSSIVTEGLLPGKDNSAIRKWASKNGVRVKDFDAAMRMHSIVRELGAAPQNPEHLLQLVIQRDQIECRYNGLLSQKSKMQIKSGDRLVDVVPEDLGDPSVATITHFTAPPSLTASELSLRLRVATANLKLGFSDSSIRDAVDSWLRRTKRDRLAAIFLRIEHARIMPFEQAPAEELFLTLAKSTFDTTEVSAAFIVCIFYKFVWSIKRKMRGLPVGHHLMPVILGPQGIGKTVFARALIAPVEEIALDVDFAALEDSRNIDIWTFFVHVLDEMGYATKADCETIKRVLTSTTLSRRPMCSNSVEVVPQNATMIGCSNKELDQLINDPTGNRRFVPVRFRLDADWDAINDFDFTRMWRSVDEHGPDPMAAHMDVLRELQAQSRQLGPVEQWLEGFENDGACSFKDGDKVRPDRLYREYRTWEEEFRPGSRPTDDAAWKSEMRRLLKNDKGVGALPFERHDLRASYGYPFVYVGRRS